jgi:hypothetical protein
MILRQLYSVAILEFKQQSRIIINTGNNTVVTAMQKGNEGENIYTNIDGAVLV